VIAFYLKQGNMGGGIYLIQADGSGEPVMLSAHPSNDSKPTWSPDGSKIAFESIRDDVANQKYMDIYMMNSDGSQLTRLTNTDGWFTEPEWSPDGNYIALASHGPDSKNLDLFVLDTNNKELTRITDDPATERNASWSPDGSQIVYASNAGDTWNIFAVDVETGDTVQLTHGPDNNAQPDWSPDGEKILFISKRDGDIEIYIMDSDGANQHRLTTSPGQDTDPEWSPDGNYFAYAHGDSKFGEIYISDLTGSSRELLFENTGQYAGFPAWSHSAKISDEPVFGPPFCLHDTNNDLKPDAVTTTFSTEELLPYVAFPYRNMAANLATSVRWDYENSDMDSLSMALAWKHGENGWYIAPAAGLPLAQIGPRKVTIQLLIGEELMQEITCEIVQP
jgi:Tol biopolymer transport system component